MFNPAEFNVPTVQEHDAAIARLDANITQAGGIKRYLGDIREQRRNWQAYHNEFLPRISAGAAELETNDPFQKVMSEAEFKRVRAMVSGMVVGELLVEDLYAFGYPNTYKPFRNAMVYDNGLGDRADEYIMLGRSKTPRGREVGYQVMASLQLEPLNEASQITLKSISTELADSQLVEPRVRLGIGLALHQSWDWATERMAEAGRVVDWPQNAEASAEPKTSKKPSELL